MAVLRLVGVWAAAAALLIPSGFVGIAVHDEGLFATGSMIVHHGGVPYRDFLTFYGPAPYYAGAAVLALFGEDLAVLRVLHIAWLACLVIAAWSAGRAAAPRRAGSPGIAAFLALVVILFVHPGSGYPAIPAVTFLLFAAAWLVDPADPGFIRRLWVASSLVGIAACFRWDFGVFGAIALTLTVVLALWWRRQPWQNVGRAVVAVVTPLAAVVIAVYIPLIVLASDPYRWYRDVVDYAMHEFPKWRQTDFLKPTYWDLLGAIGRRDVFAAFEAACRVALLFVSLIGLVVGTGCLARELSKGRERFMNATPPALFAALLSALLFNQMRVRPSLWHALPAIVATIPVALYARGVLEDATGRWRSIPGIVRTVTALTLATAALVAMVTVTDRLVRGSVPLALERASLIRNDVSAVQYRALVRYLRLSTTSADRLYAGVADHSRLILSDSLIYFLAGRLPADRFVELDPGLANTLDGQREIAAALARHRPVVVTYTYNRTEPNLTASSNGVYVLDQFIRRHYAATNSFGPYTVYRYVNEEP